MNRPLKALYGVVTYLAFLGTFVYAIGFVEGLAVPKTIDDGPATSTTVAVAINLVLLAVFAVQHSVMARPWFKRWWTRFVPEEIERSTYVAFATAALALLLWQWRPLPAIVWEVDAQLWRGLIYGVSFAGWGLLLVSTFLIDHFGDRYRDYRQRVPMLIPSLRDRTDPAADRTDGHVGADA